MIGYVRRASTYSGPDLGYDMFGRRKRGKAYSEAAVRNFGRRLRSLFATVSPQDKGFYNDVENLLVESDFGAAAAVSLVDELRRKQRLVTTAWNHDALVKSLKEMLRPSLKSVNLSPIPGRLTVYLVLGVNGVGKTTTIAKMAHRFNKGGSEKVYLAAADTFRAAAIEQLGIHGRRVGAKVIKQEYGADPGAVIFDAIASALAGNADVVIVDSAGRMHNRVNLVKELSKMDRVIRERIGEGGRYWRILVLDATTGQNALRQAETFHEAVGVDALVMTKYDSSARGGLVATIGRKLNLPIAFLGRGEGMDDLLPFDADSYLDDLLNGA